MSGSNGGSGGQGGHYSGAKMLHADSSGITPLPALPYRGDSPHLSPIGYDVRGFVWQCPRCRTHIRVQQIHTCEIRHSTAIIWFVGGSAQYYYAA